MSMEKNYGVKAAPNNVYESWNVLHQQRPNLYVTALFFDADGGILVQRGSGVCPNLWTLPNIKHQCRGDREGIIPAFCHLISGARLRIDRPPQSVQIADVTSDMVASDPIFALLQARVVASALPNDDCWRWVYSEADLRKLGGSHSLVLVAARSAMPHSEQWGDSLMTA